MAKCGPKGPSKYRPKLAQKLIKFFSIDPYRIEKGHAVPNDLPHMIDFAMKIGVTTETLRAWSKEHSEFSVAYKIALEKNEKMLMTNTLKGLYNPAFAIFTAKNKFGWRDEQYLKGEGFSNIMQVIIPKNYRPKNSKNRLFARSVSNVK